MKTFSRQTYVHTHSPTAHTHTYTHWKGYTHTLAHSYTHTHRLLWMWVTGPCSPSSVRKQSRSLFCSPTASARLKKTQFDDYNGLAISQFKTTAAHLCALKTLTFPSKRQPPCFAYLNVASRWWGPGGLGRKNRRPTSHYDVQSCAIETVGRTILQVQ